MDVARTAVWVLLAVLITLFAVLNVKSVKVDWIFGSSSAPLIVVIVISLLVGVALTHIAERRGRKR
jgi:lipopolysaccharide assembly protein A